MMPRSMTGFASREGHHDVWSWSWDLRSVNGRGLDIRLRLPDWIEGLEQGVKAQIAHHARRGNVTLGLRITRDEGTNTLSINQDALNAVLGTLHQIESHAQMQGIAIAPVTALDLMSARGVMDATQIAQDTAPLKDALLADLERLLRDFVKMRTAEGRALEAVLTGQIDTIEALTKAAAEAAEARRPQVARTLKVNLARIVENTDGVDADRVAQELAMLAVKADTGQPNRAQAGFPDARIQSRGQYALLQVAGHRAHRNRA